MTIDEMREIEEERKRKEQLRKEWLKEKDWFIVLDANILYDEVGKVVFRVSELRDNIEMFDDLKYRGSCELVYRTNQWKENLEELY